MSHARGNDRPHNLRGVSIGLISLCWASRVVGLPLPVCPTFQWSRIGSPALATPGTDALHAVTVDPSGNIIVAGMEDFTAPGQGRNWIVRKYDAAGTTLWSDLYDSPGGGSNDEANGVAVDGTGNIVAAGVGYTISTGWLIRKYDPTGNLQWMRTYTSPGFLAGALGIGVDLSGNAIVAGYDYRVDIGEGENWMVRKYDPAGGLLWSRTFNSGGAQHDRATCVALDSSGDIVIGGIIARYSVNTNWLLRKMTPAGDLVWSRSFAPGSSGAPEMFGAAVDAGHNIIAVGQGSGIWLIAKYDANGLLLWTRAPTTSPSSFGTALGVTVDPAGNIFVTGVEDSEVRLRKYDSNGNLLWSKDYRVYPNGSNYDAGEGIARDAAGALYVTGHATTGSPGGECYAGPDEMLIKFVEANGTCQDIPWTSAAPSIELTPTVLWSRSWNQTASDGDTTSGVAVDSHDHIYVAGTASSNFPTPWILQKYDATGAPIWSRTYMAGGGGWNGATAVTVGPDDDPVVAGRMNMGGSGFDMVTVKYSKDGAPLWSELWVGPGNNEDVPSAVTVDSLGNVIVAGYSKNFNGTTNDRDWVILKYDPDGNLLWSRGYGSAGGLNDTALGVAIGPNGEIVVAGDEGRSVFLGDGLIRKYATDGSLVWSRTVAAFLADVKITPAGEIVVTGQSSACAQGQGWNWIVARFTSAGDLISQFTYDGLPNHFDDMASVLSLDAGGNLIVAGMVNSLYGSGAYEIHKYAADGTLLWAFDPSMSGFIGVWDATVDSSDHVIGIGTQNWTVYKLAMPSPTPPPSQNPTEPIGAGTVKIVGGIRGYLDPKRGEEATILVRPATAGNIRVRIYDMAGALVKEMVRTTTGGRTEVMGWNSTDASGNPVPAGVYPVFIEAPGIKYKDKLVVVR